MSTPVPRCHLYLPIIDAAGVVYPYATVSFNDPLTGIRSPEPIFTQPVGGLPIRQPLFMDPAVIDIWTDHPIRLQVVATVANSVRIQLDAMDLLPEPSTVVKSPSPLRITGSDTAPANSVLMTSLTGEAVFRVTNPVATHQHEGDSPGSMVMTGEDATDYNPNQTWMGYQAGENSAVTTTGSSALGPHAVLHGASATIAGIGQVTFNPATNLPGDSATVLSSEDGTATAGSTTIGAANLAKQGLNMTLVGSLNGPSSSLSTPDGAVAVGPGNVTGAAGSVKIGPNHPTSTAGPNHTSIGSGNVSQNNGLPWAGAQAPVAVGTSTTLAGDPSTALSTDDWFGGVGPLAIGVNSPAFNPSLTTLSGAASTQTLLKVNGDAVVNGQLTYSGTTTTLGFFGNTGVVKPKITYDPGDVTNTQVWSLCQALAKAGLIYVTDVPVLSESGTHSNGSALEFAETGQALQWSLPPASPGYRATNPFTVASNQIVLNSANGPYPTRGCPAVYSSGLPDVSVQGRFTYNPTGTNLVTDSSFESGVSAWGTWDGSTEVWDNSGTRARFGDSSMKVVPSGVNTAARASYNMSTTPGQQFHWSAWVYPTVAKNIRVSVEALDSSFGYVGVGGYVDFPSLPLNTWTRIGTTGTIPAGGINGKFLVGYFNNVNLLTSDILWVDAAMLVPGSVQMPYVDSTGYHPHDRDTGIMFRAYNAQSGSGGGLQAVPTGYVVGRSEVRLMTGNTYTTVAALSTIPLSGDLVQADCSGTSVTVRVNGASVATFTDSTLNTRVKHGFRICDTTSAYALQVYPFGF